MILIHMLIIQLFLLDIVLIYGKLLGKSGIILLVVYIRSWTIIGKFIFGGIFG